MRRALVVLLVVGFLFSCHDGDGPTVPRSPDGGGAISDGTGTIGDVGSSDVDLTTPNTDFYWLPPMVDQPDESELGTFDPEAMPTVRIVCWDSDQSTDCDRDEALVEFTLGDGLKVEEDHYHASFDVRNAGLETSGDDSYTTYRIEVLTPTLGKFGGPFVMGFADFQIGDSGREARNLDTNETIGLIDNRTLPIKFRLDEGALEQEVRVNTEPMDDPTGADEFCEINCSVTVIDPDEPTEASLTDEETGDEITAMLVPGDALWTDEPTALLIDELEDDGDEGSGELCLTSSDFPTEACFRYELSADNPTGDDFTQDVRFGICPEGQAVSGGSIVPTWRLLKADEVNGDVEITRPDEVDVSDFLQCDVSTTVTLWDGPGGRLAASALQWLVPPLRASDLWGGQLRDLSDLFWGEDIEMIRQNSSASAVEGTTLQMTVELLAIHNDSAPVPGRTVTFERTAGSILSPAAGFPAVSSIQDSILSVETDTAGRATVNWTVADGTNRLEATSPDARPAAGEPDPVAFEVSGTTADVLFGVNASDDGLSEVDPVTAAVTFIGELDPDPAIFATPVAMAVRGDGTQFVWNNDSGNQTTGDLLTVDPCTGDATEVDAQTPGQGELQALAFGPGDELFGVNFDLYAIDPATGARSPVGSLGSGLRVAGADFDPNGTLYGLELDGDPATGGRLVTIDSGTGAATVVSTLDTDVGTVGSIVFAPDGTLVGSGFDGPNGDILFEVDVATGAVTDVRQISGAVISPQGMGYTPTPACP